MDDKFMAERVEVPQVHPQIYERKGRKKSYVGKVYAALLSAHIDAGAKFTDIVEIEIQEQLNKMAGKCWLPVKPPKESAFVESQRPTCE